MIPLVAVIAPFVALLLGVVLIQNGVGYAAAWLRTGWGFRVSSTVRMRSGCSPASPGCSCRGGGAG